MVEESPDFKKLMKENESEYSYYDESDDNTSR